MHLYVHCSIIYNSKDLEAAQVPISRLVDKKVVLHDEMLCSHKNKEILHFLTVWMDLENVMLSEISWSEKDKYHMVSLICGI